MALGDVIGRPLVNPIEGLAGGVQAGFEIAQNKEKLRIANEELALKKQEVQAEYLSKGITTLTALSKVKNSQQRKALGGLLMDYMRNGGLPFKQQTVEAFLADPETTKTWSEALQQGAAEHPDDPVLAWAKAAELAGKDPEEAMKDTLQLREAQLKSGYQIGVEQYKSKVAERKAALEQYNKSIEDKSIPDAILARASQLYPGNMGNKAQYINLYRASIGNDLVKIEDGIRAGLPEAKKNPQKLKELTDTIAQAKAQYIPDTAKATELKNKALQLFGELKGAYKPQTGPMVRPKDSLDLFAKAQGILEKTISTEQKTRIDNLNTIIATANDPELRKNPFTGQSALSAFGKANDPRTGVREQEYARIAKESGSTLEGIRSAFERALTGKALTETQWADLNNAAAAMQKRVKNEFEAKIKAIKPRLNKAGITDEELYGTIVKFEAPVFGIKEQQVESPAVQKKTLKPLPSAAMLDSLKGKLKPNVSLRQFLDSQGYDTSKLKD